MKYIITVLLSVALIWSLQQNTPVKKSSAERASTPVVTVAAKPSTPTETSQQDGREQKQPVNVPVETPVQIPPTTEEDAKAFIYQNESGNSPAAQNMSGCYGLGQDCNGIVETKCGTDYSCQDAFFTDYMLRRYKTWQAAKSFWLARVPINGQDVGNWW